MNYTMLWITIGSSALIILTSIILQMRNDIANLKSTIDKIAKQVGIPDLITAEIKDELINLISNGNQIKAIKKYRMVTGVGLKEAKDYIDQLSLHTKE